MIEMTDQSNLIISKYKNKYVVIDTNLLLVFLVGCVDPELITKFNRTNSRYCKDDFKILDDFIAKFKKFATTPNILTEVSNLGGQLKDNAKYRFFAFLAQFIQKVTEKYIPSSEISKDDLFIKFGITDRGIFELDKSEHLILTDDYKLASFCGKLGFDSINFNHLRNYHFDS